MSVQKEIDQIIKWLESFLNENMSNKYGPSLSNLLFKNIYEGLKKVEQKHNEIVLDKEKVPKNGGNT